MGGGGGNSENVISNAVLIFKTPRNAFVLDCLLELNSTFSTSEWGYNGPHVVTRVWSKWAERADVADSVSVVSQNTFYLFSWSNVAPALLPQGFFPEREAALCPSSGRRRALRSAHQ